MKLKFFYFLVFCYCFVNNTSAQTTYYCDPVNGSNSNGGSQANPFSTFGSVNWASKNLQDNDIIYLLDGNHGEAYLGNQQFSTNLLIKSVNNQQAVITKIQINNSNHITFQDIKFDASLGSFSKDESIIVGNDNTNYITLENCLIQSSDDSSTWTKTDWYNKSASGIQFRGTNITLTNNTFLNLYHAVEVRGNNTVMQNNLIENFAADAIRGLGSDSTYENNVIKNCFIDDYDIQHDDAFQAFIVPGSGIISNVTFRNNSITLFENPSQFVIDNDLIGTLMQGVIITDGNAEGWIVENNLISSSQSHGITLYGAQNCRIQNNTVIQTPHIVLLDDVPWISIQDQSKSGGRVNKDNIIRNNIAGRFTTWTYGSNTTDESNLDINQSDVANYDTYFIDYANGDFHQKETSPSINYGVNTDVFTTDLDGNDRIYNNETVDAGCYEFQGNGTPNSSGVYEINSIGDGNVSNPTNVTTNNPTTSGISVGTPSESSLFIGGRDVNHDGNTTSAILPFRLPKRPTDQNVIEASLKVNLHYVKEWITSNIDLYGLPYNSSATLNASDHYDDVFTNSNGTDTAIQDDFITRTENTGSIFTPDRKIITNSTGNSALINYITAQYNAGATEGDYIFLRLNIDVPIDPNATSALPTAASHFYAISDETTGDNAPLLTLKISTPLSVENQIKDKNKFLIYPNPTKNGKITIKGKLLNQKSKLNIFSLKGRLVYSEEISPTNTNQIQTKINLSKGIYFLKVTNKTGFYSQKLIIN